MILLMGGTRDARTLLATINAAFPGTMIVASAVSTYGADLLREQGGCVVLQKAMNAGELTAFIREKGVRVIVDATHPFAENASAAAGQAAAETGIAYLRYERPSTSIEAGSGLYFAPDFQAAAVTAARLGRTIFFTIGSRRLKECLGMLPHEKRVVARVLPDEDSIRQCLTLGLTPADIVAVQGPVSQALNAALFTEYKADVVVAKDSGETGGTPEKIAAARELKIPIVLVRRPAGNQGTDSPAQIVSALRKIFP